MTGQVFANLYASKILGLATLQDQHMDPMREEARQQSLDLWGGGGVLSASAIAFTYSSGKLTLATAFEGWTGTGYRIDADPADDGWSSIPYQNTGGVTYYVGARWNEYPSGVEVGQDGSLNYVGWTQAIGDVGAPSAVALSGADVILTVTSLVSPVWTAADTRPCIVWMTDQPAQEAAAAEPTVSIFEGTVAYHAGSGTMRVTVTGALGQSDPSLTAADYQVLILGPRISTTDLSAVDDYLYFGSVTTGVFSTSGQRLLSAVGDWISAFLVQHDASGLHTTITGQTIDLSGLSAVKFRSTAFSAPDSANNPQLRLRDNTPNNKVELWTDQGGSLRFPRADVGTGAGIDARDSTGAVTRTVFTITNGQNAAHYADIVHDGRIDWNPVKSGNTWRLACNLAAHQTMRLENLNATYRASLNLIYGNLDLDNGQIICDGQGVILGGANPVYAWASSQKREPKIPGHIGWDLIAGGRTVFMGSGVMPPYVHSSAAALLTLAIPLNAYFGLDPEDAGLVLNGVEVNYYRISTTGSIVVRLRSSQVSGTPGTITTHYTWTANTSAGWSTSMDVASTGLGLTLDTRRMYWLEVDLDPTGAGTPADYRLNSVKLTLGQLYAL